MAPECHSLLKMVCALKGVTVSEYVYKVIAEDFRELVKTDNQVQQMFFNGKYPVGSKAYVLQEQIRKELNLWPYSHFEISTSALIRDALLMYPSICGELV